MNVDIAAGAIVITAYMLPFGLFQLLYGYLAERFGKRQVITFAISMFTIATAMCAFAVAIPDLAAYRAITGMFAAAIMPISIALIAGRKSGKIAAKIGRKKTVVIGLSLACVANIVLVTLGGFLSAVILAIGLMGFGFMMAHSTFLTLATEFAAKERSYATSLIAFFFMTGGGIGTAIGGRIVAASSYGNLFTIYGLGLVLVTICALFVKSSFNTSSQPVKIL